MASLEATQDTPADNQLIQLWLINQIREATRKEPKPHQKNQGGVLRALLIAAAIRCCRAKLLRQ
jgi:hypothetical protein